MRIKILKLIKLTFILFAVVLMIIYSYNNIYGSTLSSTEDIEQFNINSTEIKQLFDRNLLNKIRKFNANLTVKNGDKFSPLNDNNLIIVVQVHNRLEYLKNLIHSLSRTVFINETLLIFSHDFYNQEINNLISKITFAKTLQIFYPFSRQIWLHTFPGTSLKDCPRNISKQKAILIKCLNANFSDSYGHYRESSITQIKHHWWWKLNFIMEHLNYTRNFHGDYLLMEEDHYTSPDLIHTWKQMKSLKENLTKNAININILTLGNYDKLVNSKNHFNQLYYTKWFSGKHNMAFTISRSLWNKIKHCRDTFCTYDDYNWDWSLQYLFDKCFNHELYTLVTVFPRVFHLGTCGLHHKIRTCDNEKQKLKIENILTFNEKYLFPTNYQINKSKNRKIKLNNNGGWSDPRDHKLCIQYQFTDEEILKINKNFVFSNETSFKI